MPLGKLAPDAKGAGCTESDVRIRIASGMVVTGGSWGEVGVYLGTRT